MNEEFKKDLATLLYWGYNASFQTLFKYNKADQTTKLSKISEEKIKKIIDKYGNK